MEEYDDQKAGRMGTALVCYDDINEIKIKRANESLGYLLTR